LHAAIRQYQVVGSVDEVIQRINEGFLPNIKDVSGFHAYYALEAGLGRLVTVSVFEDRAGIEESTRMAADWIRENMASLFPDPPEVLEGEVFANEAASGGPVSAATDTMGGVTDTVGGATSGVTDTVGGLTGGLTGGLLGGGGDKEKEDPERRGR